MSSSFDCRKCGASLPVPADLFVMVVRCQYCAADQSVPDLEARQRALANRGSPVAARGSEVDVARILRWMIAPAVLGALLTPVVVLFGTPSARPAPDGLTGAAGGWDGTHTLECKDKERFTLRNVDATVQGVAIHAVGNCNVNIYGGRIKADTAIVTAGHATVTMFDVVIDAPITLDASERSIVFIYKGRTNGKVIESGHASVSVQ